MLDLVIRCLTLVSSSSIASVASTINLSKDEIHAKVSSVKYPYNYYFSETQSVNGLLHSTRVEEVKVGVIKLATLKYCTALIF